MTECSFYNSGFCSSCELIKLPYPEQLKKKSAFVQCFLGAEAQVSPCIGSDLLFNSRNKAKMAVGGSQQNPRLGFVKSDYSVSDITDCPLHIEAIRPILRRIKELITRFGIHPYDIASKSGELKFVIVRMGNRSKQTVVRFVVRSEEQRPQLTELAKILESEFDEIEVVSLNLQPIHQAVIEGDTEIVLSSQDFAIEEMGGYFLAFSPASFGQVTPGVAEKLYKYVANCLEQSHPQSVLDLYCGVGIFSIFSHKSFDHCTGIEISETAIRNANQSAQLNGVTNIKFIAQDVEKFLEGSNENFEAIVVNPPRRGLGEKISKHLIRLAPKSILYSSCNPESLARDVSILAQQYILESVQPFDMFPLTNHVEAVAIMRRR